MSETDFKPGDVVSHKSSGSPALVLIKKSNDTKSWWGRYYSSESDSYLDSTFDPSEFVLHPYSNSDYVKLSVGDKVNFKGAINHNKVITHINEEEGSALCRYWKSSIGNFHDRRFYLVELERVGGF